MKIDFSFKKTTFEEKSNRQKGEGGNFVIFGGEVISWIVHHIYYILCWICSRKKQILWYAWKYDNERTSPWMDWGRARMNSCSHRNKIRCSQFPYKHNTYLQGVWWMITEVYSGGAGRVQFRKIWTI